MALNVLTVTDENHKRCIFPILSVNVPRSSTFKGHIYSKGYSDPFATTERSFMLTTECMASFTFFMSFGFRGVGISKTKAHWQFLSGEQISLF